MMRQTWLALVLWMGLGGALARAQESSLPTPEAPAGEAPRDPDDADTARDEDAELESLLQESVVSTAARSAQRSSDAPATSYTISARELEMFGIRTVDEALSYLGVGFYITRPRDYETGIDVGVSGLLQRDGGRHILVMVDGHIMNSQDTGTVSPHEGLGVPLEAIDYVEVMLGAGSVAYGSNAMVAVINVVTRHASRGTQIHGVAELGLASPSGYDGQPGGGLPQERVGLRYRLGVGLSTAFRLFGSPADLTVRGEWVEDINNSYGITPTAQDDFSLRPGETAWGGTATHTMTAPAAIARLRVGDFQLRVLANQYTRGIPLSGAFVDPWSRELRESLRGELRHDASLSPEVSLGTRFYADYTRFSERTSYRLDYWCVPGQVDGCNFELGSAGRSAGLEQVLRVDWTLDGRFASTLGYDVRGRDMTARPADYYDVITGEPSLVQATPYVHRVTVLGAVFAQQIVRPIDWLTLNLGARLDVDSSFGARVSPRAAAVLTPLDHTSIRASYAEAFRTPTSYELGQYDPTYQISALSLRPEVVRTVELEWQQGIDWVTFSLRGFASFYEDFIASREATEAEHAAAVARGEVSPTSMAEFFVRNDNLASLRTFGGTASVSMRPTPGLTLAGSFMLADTRAGDDRIPIMPLWSGNARIAYELSPNGASFALAAIFAGSRIAYSSFSLVRQVELGEQLDLRLTFTSPLDFVPGLHVRASVSYSLNGRLPYLINGPIDAYPDAPPLYTPVTSPLFGFVGLRYDLPL
ncbi:MAG: TonB-dependent receptor [Sandaracinaceae bacterium]|nr:TonB-dependent receptor [Sandaracinaceae bacterium]